jgi:hypothetical protein
MASKGFSDSLALATSTASNPSAHYGYIFINKTEQMKKEENKKMKKDEKNEKNAKKMEKKVNPNPNNS